MEGTAIGDRGAVLLEVGAAAEVEVAAGEKHRDFDNDASRFSGIKLLSMQI